MRVAVALAACCLLLGLAMLATPAASEPMSRPHTPTPTPYPASFSAEDWMPQIVSLDGIDVVLVPAGCFVMGSAQGEPDELPRREVCLSRFWMGRTEITNAQYAACVDAGFCNVPHDVTIYADPAWADHPVVMVDWFMANDYANWLGCRLPTEAEWEYAARGPAAQRYPWGPDFDGSRLNFCDSACLYEWRDAQSHDGFATTAPVGSFPDGGSWVGALDLLGNVWEWTADWYLPDAYTSLPDGVRDPVGPDAGWGRTVRGGSYASAQTYTRAASRDWDSPNLRFVVVGFRIACDAARVTPGSAN